ncbi:tRNA 2-thiouridine(34) synthase MnmA [Calycomorphotria hydatis]|uniref:tRNA-specific 2-thiouridylase MnmA n=1 Tax=Calycomorphotria hydatis TaxID=2528027 RepID=A0A517TB12_9PLAN|nr:tRNA 2-thiouridine(34) synthase MnmA [Calycomorphotria hydatis]QDT65550.1 tRNA-specific 2-thiouridylase MnmA [Calycomorphotria hydatis]
MERVVLAMSGGVDSSASAVLLQRAGYEVIGLFMRSGATEEQACALPSGGPSLPIVETKAHKQGCCSASDAADARRVADALDIPFHALNFKDAFGRIKDYFADEYLAGRTPNPCVMCNNWLKFGKLWDFAQQVGATKIASGHYARLATDGVGNTTLIRGRDLSKDQSYVLFGIDRELLPNILFPVGDYDKSDIREYAREAGLRVADKRDSYEVCFVPNDDYAGFLRNYRGDFDTAGELVDHEGNVVGQHAGYEKFTIGQRKGLGVTFGEPRFVTKIDAETKRVHLGRKQDLKRTRLSANRTNWLVEVNEPTFQAEVAIRYQFTPVPATVTVLDDERFDVEFDEPVAGVAPGQAAVVYRGDRVLGGGWIC